MNENRFTRRGRRPSEISWMRFGVGASILTGMFLPALSEGGTLTIS